MTKATRGWGVLLAALLLPACGGVARVPDDSFYRLDIAAPAAAARPPLQGGLIVQGNAGAPLYRDRALLYSEAAAPRRVQRYHYHYWADSPPRLLQRGLADYLRAAGIAAPVLAAEDGQDARYRLRVDIERFEHLRAEGGGRVAVALRLLLIEREQGLRMQETMQTSVAVNGADFTAVVAAYERALADLYGRIGLRLAQLE